MIFFCREIQVLTCIEEDVFPPRVKQFWVPVTMSGQVAALIESTQLLWQMKQDPEQVLSHLQTNSEKSVLTEDPRKI